MAFGYLLFRENSVKMYFVIANPAKDMDLLVKIGNRVVFNDSLRYSIFEYQAVEEKLRFGWYDMTVSSKSAGISLKRKIFVIFDQYVVVQYYPKSDLNEKMFGVDHKFTPFYFE